jgi:hypothetical protein
MGYAVTFLNVTNEAKLTSTRASRLSSCHEGTAGEGWCPPLSDNPVGVGALRNVGRMGNSLMLRGTNLRYVLTRYLQLNGPTTVADLVVALDGWGFTVAGRPSKAISDALRWERVRDRVRPLDRGLYAAKWGIPRGTEHRIHQRVAILRAEARQLSLGGGQRP